MDIDLAALRMIEREKEIPVSVLIAAIEQALLVAYHRTEGAQQHARVELDRQTGHVVVWATETLDDGTTREYDDTPAGFGRIADVDGPAGDPAAAARRRGRAGARGVPRP